MPQVARVLRELLPRRHWTRAELGAWLLGTLTRNARAYRSHRLSRSREPSL